MIYGVYSILDRLTGYMQLTVEFSDQSAARNFEHASMNDSSLFHSHFEDYSLCKVGTFDSESGVIHSFDHPQVVVTGSQVHFRKEGS